MLEIVSLKREVTQCVKQNLLKNETVASSTTKQKIFTYIPLPDMPVDSCYSSDVHTALAVQYLYPFFFFSYKTNGKYTKTLYTANGTANTKPTI